MRKCKTRFVFITWLICAQYVIVYIYGIYIAPSYDAQTRRGHGDGIFMKAMFNFV